MTAGTATAMPMQRARANGKLQGRRQPTVTSAVSPIDCTGNATEPRTRDRSLVHDTCACSCPSLVPPRPAQVRELADVRAGIVLARAITRHTSLKGTTKGTTTMSSTIIGGQDETTDLRCHSPRQVHH